MENILVDRIKTVHLTKKQQLIADYFIKNQDRLASLSSIEVANEISVSDASVIRFSRLIGFEGYADLKAKLYNKLVENSRSPMSLSERMQANDQKFGNGDISTQFFQVLQRNCNLALEYNHTVDFNALADDIIRARKRYVIGMRGCKGTAISFARLLAFMLPNVLLLTDNECTSINQAQDMGKEDMVIMFAFSRFYKIDLEYLALSKKRGARVCLIVDDVTGPLTRYADIVLVAAVESVNFFRSSVGITILSEYILTMVGKKIDFHDRIEERDRMTEFQRL